MAQSLLIGLGGTGSRVVNNVVKELQRNGKTINDGNICCAVLDTNCSDNSFIEESGTNVPVVGTSKPQRIEDYFAEYPSMKEWSPESPAFLKQSMLDGASETRVKSRIAFEDCIQSGVARDLEDMINQVLQNGENSKIRIMLVSSISGGTGSGMFIQVALWLRKILAGSQISIRGIFLLPDVFINTIRDIRENKTTQVRHRANAYAAIRELNAVTKVTQGSPVELMEHFKINGLFDSATDMDKGEPVFDYAFFVDYKDARGVYLDEISDYEKMVAQLVYMQLYSPMVDDMYSEEDNLFQAFVANDEPKYGSCGGSKAVYPVDSVKSYSAMRAVQDSLQNGWQRIDDEIAERAEEKKQAELERGLPSDAIDPRYEFVRLFEEKTSVSAEEAGRDRFFLDLAKEAKNEKKGKRDANGKVPVTYSDKVEDFIRLLKTDKIDRMILTYGRTGECARNAEKFIAEDHDAEAIKKIVKGDEEKMASILDEFDERVDEYATTVANSVFPYSMGDVAEKNRCTIHGLMTKPNEMGGWDYVHPIVARYLCYRLVSRLELALTGIDLESSREDAVTGGDINVLIQFFDNPATPQREASAEQMADSKRWYQSEAAFMDKVEEAYMKFMTNKIELCDTYQKECLQVHVYRKLIERIELLIKELEAFFESLSDAKKSLDKKIEENVAGTNGVVGKTVYVFASRENKEQIYRSLDLGQNKSNTEINRSILNAAYGRVCAEKRPSNEENAAYRNVGAAVAFLREAITTYRKRIDKDANNKEKLDLDLYTALCKESDAKHAAGGRKEQTVDFDALDYESGTVKKDNGEALRHNTAFADCKNLLEKLATPCLRHEKEVSENDMGTVTARPKTFWGYHPALVASCPILGRALGINTELQANDAYPKNELHCYSAVYGMEARFIPQFNEMRDDEKSYYKAYKFTIDEMVKDANSRMGDRAYVRTPHLDKRWHRILPFVTEEMQNAEAQRFFRGFWLGVAYGNVKVGKDGNMYVRRSVDAGYGNMIDEDVPVYHTNRPVGRTDVAKLVEALRADTVFTSKDIPGFEQRFAEELATMDTYIGTKVMQGLVKKNEYLQPVDMVARYCDGTNQSLAVVGAMIGALEGIAADLAGSYYRARTGERSDAAKYRICKRIHAAATRKNVKINAFRKWEEMFAELKIADEVGSEETAE